MIDTADPIVAWHFIRNDFKLRYGDDRTVRRGEVLCVTGEPKMCNNGMHGSLRALDALRYAPGTIVCRTVHSGLLIFGGDKLVSQCREVVWMADATEAIVVFAKWCAARAAAHFAGTVGYHARYATEAARHTIEAAKSARYATAATGAAAVAANATGAAGYAAAAAGADVKHAIDAEHAEQEAQNDELTRLLCELGQKNPLWPT